MVRVSTVLTRILTPVINYWATTLWYIIAYSLTVRSVIPDKDRSRHVKDTILRASVETAAAHGLNDWTVEEVANRARCAKGLVNYHYGSKGDLLGCTAETVAMDRLAR